MEFQAKIELKQARRRCCGCGRAITIFDRRVVPRFRYSRDVIGRALELHRRGHTWDQSAGGCTTASVVDVSLIKRWARQFELSGIGVRQRPPGVPFRRRLGPARVMVPAESRSPDPLHKDSWANAPPKKP